MFWMQWRLKSAGVCIVFILAPRVSVATHLHFLALLPPPASLLPSSCWSSSASPRAARRHQVNRPTRTSPSSIIKCPNCRPSVFRSPDQGWDGLGSVTHQRRPATTSRSADNCSAEKSLWGPPPPLHSSPRFCNLIHRHLTLHLKHRVWGVFFCRYDVCNFSVDFWGEGAEG